MGPRPGAGRRSAASRAWGRPVGGGGIRHRHLSRSLPRGLTATGPRRTLAAASPGWVVVGGGSRRVVVGGGSRRVVVGGGSRRVVVGGGSRRVVVGGGPRRVVVGGGPAWWLSEADPAWRVVMGGRPGGNLAGTAPLQTSAAPRRPLPAPLSRHPAVTDGPPEPRPTAGPPLRTSPCSGTPHAHRAPEPEAAPLPRRPSAPSNHAPSQTSAPAHQLSLSHAAPPRQ
jgi:hypothetical protein